MVAVEAVRVGVLALPPDAFLTPRSLVPPPGELSEPAALHKISGLVIDEWFQFVRREKQVSATLLACSWVVAAASAPVSDVSCRLAPPPLPAHRQQTLSKVIIFSPASHDRACQCSAMLASTTTAACAAPLISKPGWTFSPASPSSTGHACCGEPQSCALRPVRSPSSFSFAQPGTRNQQPHNCLVGILTRGCVADARCASGWRAR